MSLKRQSASFEHTSCYINLKVRGTSTFIKTGGKNGALCCFKKVNLRACL